MNILVIFTGGTIGSALEKGWISTDSDTKFKLIKEYRQRYNDSSTEFDTQTPYFILSENLSACELTKLSECINSNKDKGYDGIIITHGTDTLQYTAAALSFMFDDFNIPIVMVSSAYPIENKKANGVDNLNAAVNFIKAKAGSGVYVSYKNNLENKVDIHLASRLTAHREASADVFSIDNNPYAFYDSGKIILNDRFEKGRTGACVNQIEFCENPDILVIDSHPGDGFNYDLEKYKAVILVPFHSATLNTENERFQHFMKEAENYSVPVFVVNTVSGAQYESTKMYEQLKINVLPMCTKSAIYMKCWIAISLGKNVKEFIKQPIAQEFIEEGDI